MARHRRGQSSVVRDANWIAREYGEEKWPAVERLVEREVDVGEAQLCRVVSRVARHEFLADSEALSPVATTIGGARVSIPQCVGWGAHQALIVEAIVGACGAQTDLIVELGAGWGRNLFLVWAGGGPAHARYIAAETTKAGRRVADRLAALEPAMRFASRAFDFQDARLDCGPSAHAVVFTVYATDQVPHLSTAALEAIRGVAQTVTCLHFEPMGWQTDGDRPTEQRTYVEENDYNRNLLQLVQDLDRRDLIDVITFERDIIGTNPKHPMSLLIWRTKP